MASTKVHPRKTLRRSDTKKSHSWWWDSHISPKNSKWLSENLEEMEYSVKRMLKLIEEDGDSFAKKAEMYYQKRPELITLVEEFYRIYRALAERYDQVTLELKKTIPSDLQSQGSGISELSSDLPSPEPKPARKKSGPRAAGFDFFLGSGGGNSSDVNPKEGEESSSLTDSGSDSDDSSVNNYSSPLGDQGLKQKIIELQIELQEVKNRVPEDGIAIFADIDAKIESYEHELETANANIVNSQKEIAKLKNDIENFKSWEVIDGVKPEIETQEEEDIETSESVEVVIEMNQESVDRDINGYEVETPYTDSEIQVLVDELKITSEQLRLSRDEIANLKRDLESIESSDKIKIKTLQEQLDLAKRDSVMFRTKLNAESKEVAKLQGRLASLRTSLSDRDHEIRDLKLAVSDAEEKIFPEKAQIKIEISKLVEDRARLEEHLRESESRCRSLEDEIRTIKTEKTDLEGKLNFEIEQLKSDLIERNSHIDNINNTFKVEIGSIKAGIISRDDRITEMDRHLRELHVEHMELISRAEEAGKEMKKLRGNVKELEGEVEKQRSVILEQGEEKREAIRQLCFSLEHYRNGYQRLRQAFSGQNKGFPVYAS